MKIWENIRLNGLRGYWKFQKLNPGRLRADLSESAMDIVCGTIMVVSILAAAGIVWVALTEGH